jgi:hypothetical protein
MLSPKNFVFSTVLRAVFFASAMGFYVICNMLLLHELGFFSSQPPARVFHCRLTFIYIIGQHPIRADLK